MKRPARASGVTLLEVVIGAALLSAIAVMIYGFMAGASSNYSRDSARQTLQDNARRVLDEIANDLRDANRDAVIIPAAPGNTSIKFQKSIGFDAATKVTRSGAPRSNIGTNRRRWTPTGTISWTKAASSASDPIPPGPSTPSDCAIT